MEKHIGEAFTNQRVEMDGKSFYDCLFIECVIVWNPDGESRVENCRMVKCEFENAP